MLYNDSPKRKYSLYPIILIAMLSYLEKGNLLRYFLTKKEADIVGLIDSNQEFININLH